MSKQPEKPCFHCEIVSLIREIYPTGIDGHEASEILMGLARVAGDILGNEPSAAPLYAFSETVAMIRAQQPREIKFIDRTKH